ncbi:MAG: hypothetical protein AAGA56_24240, partial [Myxococcota bacterium]
MKHKALTAFFMAATMTIGLGCDEGGAKKSAASATSATTAAKPTAAPPPSASAPKAAARTNDTEEGADAGDASDLKSPKGSIARQIELLKEGNHVELATWFTAQQRPKITKKVVEDAQGQASMMKVDNLIESVEMGEHKNKKTAKVKMKNGRTLTTLVQEGDRWLA